MMSIETKFVIHWTNGLTSRIFASAWAVPSAVNCDAIVNGGLAQVILRQGRACRT